MDDSQRKAQLRKTFDTVAEGYGSRGMEFFHNAAAHLPRGKVTGIDLSEGMLAQARARAQGLGFKPKDIDGFVSMVPMGNAEIIRLQHEGYSYMR